MSTDAPSIIVFDGVCLLCNRWVDFILRHDRAGRFHFAAMQGVNGRALLQAHGLSPDDPSSLLLIDGEGSHTDTAAIRRILQGLGGGWKLPAMLLAAIPRVLRDPADSLIARHRYQWFGRRDCCRLPDPAEADRFLD
jgi:predicted DCC family thiol-disulfide oxidoreductase YuxK